MGDGRVHFRFQREEDLQLVLDNRPYHYDGSMIALERWVPTVRRDFPNTIPFWIIIRGLPDYRREEKTVRSIGEDLGEFHEVDVTEPIPKVRVTLDCNSPLILRRETVDVDTLCILDLQYEKLHKYCTRCLRLTHEAPVCPKRPREPQQHREQKVEEGIASSSKPKPVRRDLLAELETSRSLEVEPPISKPSTKEWVRRTFRQADISDGTHPNRNNGEDLQTQPELKRSKIRAPWYRTTVEEAAIANEVFSQTAKWQAAENWTASEKQIETLETAEREDKRSPSRVSSTGLLDFSNGPAIREAQQAEASVELVDQQSTTL
ncbi:hypothetical protein AALP_AA8G335100, partial [Arabis alpina]